LTIRDFEQIFALRNEAADLERRIRRCEVEAVADTVTGSSREAPYQPQVIRITGVESADSSFPMRVKLVARRERIKKLLAEIDDFIDTVEDSDVRLIIQLRYIDGDSWRVVARKVYGYPCEDRARMKITRFFAEI